MKKLAASKVAAPMGFSRKILSNIIRCKRKVYADEVVPIAKALGVGIEDLFLVQE